MTKNNTLPKTDIPAEGENRPALQPSEAQIEAKNNYMAKTAMSPEFSAALVVDAYRPEGKLDFLAIMAQLEAQHAILAADSLVQAENMLMSQAMALDAIFSQLAVRAIHAKGLDQTQCLLGLALRAQNGSRATLQTLGELKNPRHTTFVKQANIAQGQQQVNNGVAPASTSPTLAQEEFPDSTNKLSGANHELLEDSRAASPAITGYPVVAAVDKVHRAKVRRG
ncbi:hypothetical protein SAMN05216344_11490 [Polaromonas sp. OV174]|uniref:hypothetical protein n=1 Tax=Polaromonas sp. OV174 TaxID=1855300 RepID=UPI0008E64526|nr:hypothetical protein [Polaromonas sp. OV174]SFC33915.1 hypothetical protein SAMN05216344_11490 [Polaromonas sp. OV174]